MPKDNESVPLPLPTSDEPVDPTPEPFTPDQMVRCDECLRANPPTRINCLYCGAVLPLNETTVPLQKPALRRLEKWELGYNNIHLPGGANSPSVPGEAELRAAADLLRLSTSDLTRILSAGMPLPLARAATIDEATLVRERLSSFGIETCVFADELLTAEGPIKVRAIEMDDTGVNAYQTPEAPAIRVAWADLTLLVVAKLIVKRVELKEQKTSRSENRILDSSEFMTDETVVDFYSKRETATYRIAVNSFDFSCLGKLKGLVAGENIATLLTVFRDHASDAVYDDSFKSVRKALEVVWPSAQQNESSGWRRERPGKYSVGSVMELSNEMQLLRYSRLLYHLHFPVVYGKNQ